MLSIKSSDGLEPLRNLIERIRVAMSTTIDAAGRLRLRPLLTLELDGEGRLWLFVSASAGEREQMNRDHVRVGIAYADPNKQDYASVTGSGVIVSDRERIRSHWNAWVELWFPQGADDPDLALLCISIEQAEYWEGPGSIAQQLSSR